MYVYILDTYNYPKSSPISKVSGWMVSTKKRLWNTYLSNWIISTILEVNIKNKTLKPTVLRIFLLYKSSIYYAMNSTQFLLFKGGKMGQSIAFPVARTDHKHRGAERYSTCRFNPLTVSQLKPVKKTPRLQFIIHNHGSGRCIWEVTTIRTIRDTPSHISLNHDYGRKGSPTSWYELPAQLRDFLRVRLNI